MSHQECNESVSWVLVFFEFCDPGMEFEIVPRNHISTSENIVLRPQMKVKVFFGKAKTDAQVILESDDREYLESYFNALKEELHRRKQNACVGLKRRWTDAYNADNNSADINCDNNNTDDKSIYKKTAMPPCCISTNEKFDVLMTKFNDLYHKHCALQTTLAKLREGFDNMNSSRQNEVIHVSKKRKITRSSCNGAISTKIKDDDVEESDDVEDNDDVVLIGENKTSVPVNIYNSINWTNCSAATRKLLVAVFGRTALATHTLTGKRSPAFLNVDKMRKGQLDPQKTADIISVVTRRCKVTASTVRSAITTKCADETKMVFKRKKH